MLIGSARLGLIRAQTGDELGNQALSSDANTTQLDTSKAMVNVPPYSEYVDPDAVHAAPVAIAPERLDARINGRRLPVNPNGGPGSFVEDGAPLRRTPGIDPTVAHFGNEIGIEATGALSNTVTIAPIDRKANVPRTRPDPESARADRTRTWSRPCPGRLPRAMRPFDATDRSRRRIARVTPAFPGVNDRLGRCVRECAGRHGLIQFRGGRNG
jgi:hypothetical protein